MKRIALAVSATLAVLVALPAAAQFQKPEQAIKYRQSSFALLGSHFGRLGPMIQGKVPFDAKVVQDNIAIAAVIAPLPFAAFGEGTDKGETKAKPEVWSKADEFKASGAKMVDAINALNAAAKTGDADKIKVAFGDTGKTCKGCHDNFRKE
ncbi:MAG: cytochrome c [Leptothrix sp. (in: b-proteobacteria)]